MDGLIDEWMYVWTDRRTDRQTVISARSAQGGSDHEAGSPQHEPLLWSFGKRCGTFQYWRSDGNSITERDGPRDNADKVAV